MKRSNTFKEKNNLKEKQPKIGEEEEDDDEYKEEEVWDDYDEPEILDDATNKIEFDIENKEFEKWARPKLETINIENDNIIFQQLDISHYTNILIENHDPESVFRIFGVNEKGNSIMAHVHGFTPYFYVEAPETINEQHCEHFKSSLNYILKRNNPTFKDYKTPVISVSYCMKSNILGYNKNEKRPFLKITLAVQSLVKLAKNQLVQGFEFGNSHHSFEAYDGDIDFTLRYMVDSGLVGCSWIEIPSGCYTIRNEVKYSLCQLEIDVNWKDIIYHNPEGEWSKIAPLRILSFDIECAGRKGIFPEYEIDPVIQISNMIIRYGESEPFIKNIFTLKSCAPIAGSHVLCFDTEKELLEHWANFIRDTDADIITGYNIQNFDTPYLINRANYLNVPNFCYLGKLKNNKSVVREAPKARSKQMGPRENKLININGRIQFDLFQILLRDYKLRSYSLNAVSYHFLGEQKEDVAYQIISDLQNGDENTRRRLAVYCLKDSYLVIRLLNKLMCIVNYVEMARVTGVPLDYLLTRGQQIKVLSQLMRKAAIGDFILPDYVRRGGEEFIGATVIEPMRGFYTKPIATLDFSSLYPSIMMAHNLCYTTYLKSKKHAEDLGLTPDDYIQTPSNSFFVKSSVKKGLLPEILEQLISARKIAKRDLALETDQFKKQVLDGRQLALKISANSVYGFTGAQQGRLPCLPISSSVTGYGRVMIEETKRLVETKYCLSNGYQNDSVVIYGDTDSVMVKFGVDSVAEAMVLGKEAAEVISNNFIKPIKLEFEKVYFPYLLINKKRYAGMYYTKPDKFDKMDCKGLENVRRDNCSLAATLLNKCLEKLLIDRDATGSLNLAQNTIRELLLNKIDISQLIISKELTSNQYTSQQAHVRVAQKITERDPGSAPQLGDRVPYVITTLGSKQMYDRAEDPMYVLANRIPIDTGYYLNNQLSKPLLRIFEPIFGEKKAKEKLLSGDHMLAKSQQQSKVGPMAKFAVVIPKCIGCKAKLKKEEKSICSHCMPHADEIYLRALQETTNLESRFSKLWTECQRCSGSFTQEVLCSNRDCPIFYMRKKIQQDVIIQRDTLDQLSRDLEF